MEKRPFQQHAPNPFSHEAIAGAPPWSGAAGVGDGGRPAAPGRESPDPGSPGTRLFTWMLVVVLFALTVFMQQCSERAAPTHAPGAAAAEQDPDGDLSAIMTRFFIKLGRAFEGAPGGSAEPLMEQIDAAVDVSPDPLRERVRAAIAAAEIAGVDEALSRLDVADVRLAEARSAQEPIEEERAAAVAMDIAILRGIYAGHTDALTDSEREHLVTRHGKLGRIAMTFGRPESDPDRQALVGGGEVLVVALMTFLGLLAIVVPASIACSIIALVRMLSRGARTAFVPPTPGGSVYLETLVIFLLGFLIVRLGVAGVGAAIGPSADEKMLTMLALVAQWPVALAALWPVLRGVPLAEHARRIGWTRGRGVAREIGAGIFGYLAGLPLVGMALAVTVVALMVRGALESAGGGPAEPPKNPVIDLALAGGALPFMLAALAVIWAPFTEESIFRGALFRHLRGRVGMIVASVVSALFFGLMHGYEVIALLPVITLGFNFALMREWRGSLIGPMIAHGLHNGTVMALLLVIVSQLG